MEIFLEHYRFGMKLSMPLVVGDKTLLDSETSIDSERMLDIIKANGVKKIDVRSSYLGELAENFPEFYSLQQERLQNARNSGRIRRVENADFLHKVRQLERKAPTITIISKIDFITDIKKILSPYFQMEHVVTSIGDTVQSIARSKLVVFMSDGFTPNEQNDFKREMKKEHREVKVIAAYKEYDPGFDRGVRLQGQAMSNLLPACFFSCFPQHIGEFAKNDLPGVRLNELSRPLLQVLVDENCSHEVDDFMEQTSSVALSIGKFDRYSFFEGTSGLLLRLKNEDSSLVKHLVEIKKLLASIPKIYVVISHVSKEEVAQLRSLGGRLNVMLGDLSTGKLHESLSAHFPH